MNAPDVVMSASLALDRVRAFVEVVDEYSPVALCHIKLA
jgi:hypothetical protein